MGFTNNKLGTDEIGLGSNLGFGGGIVNTISNPILNATIIIDNGTTDNIIIDNGTTSLIIADDGSQN